MVDSAKTETEKNNSREYTVTVPITSAHIYEQATNTISEELTKAGHPKTPAQVSADGEAREVLSSIEKEGIGVQIADAGHHLKRVGENLAGDFSGSHRTYVANERPTGHLTTLRRALGIAKDKGKSIILNNLLRIKK